MLPSHDDHNEIAERLSSLGLRGISEIRLHRNRVVMLSLRQGILRLHAGYAHAPDPVLRAIVRFLTPHTRRAVVSLAVDDRDIDRALEILALAREEAPLPPPRVR